MLYTLAQAYISKQGPGSVVDNSHMLFFCVSRLGWYKYVFKHRALGKEVVYLKYKANTQVAKYRSRLVLELWDILTVYLNNS